MKGCVARRTKTKKLPKLRSDTEYTLIRRRKKTKVLIWVEGHRSSVVETLKKDPISGECNLVFREKPSRERG